MNWIIDGHNLIGQLQDLSLDDPYDEAKLTMAIRSYCMRGKGDATATVFFDNGMPGGLSRELSSANVKVYFAPPRTSADDLLMKRAREIGGLKGNFKDTVLVTSDNRILRLCHAYGIETMASEEFALLIGFRPVEIDPETAPNGGANGGGRGGAASEPGVVKIVYEKDPNPNVSPQEIAYWLPIFKRRLHEVRAAQAAARIQEREEAIERAKNAKLKFDNPKSTPKPKPKP